MKIEIQKNATNGEVIQSMFPEAKWLETQRYKEISADEPCMPLRYFYLESDWWNRQYNAESIEIPQNATNGEVIQSMFSEAKWLEIQRYNEIFTDVPCYRMRIYLDLDWWNARYKAESEEKYK